MERYLTLLLSLCLSAAQNRTEEAFQDTLQWMMTMESVAKSRRMMTTPPSVYLRGLETRLLDASFSGPNLTLQTPNIHSLAFNLDCDFRGLSLHNATHRGDWWQHSMQFPAELMRRPCRSRPRPLRLICIYFFSNFFFQSDIGDSLLSNLILGAQLDHEHVSNLAEPINVSFWHNQSLENYTAACVFWQEGASKNTSGTWSTEGCRTERPLPSQVLCQCTHLSYFAVLVQPSPVRAELVQPLVYITIVGCSVSAVASLLTLLLHCHTRKQSDPIAPVHMNLQASVLVLNVAFLLSPVLAELRVPGPACSALAATLHCALLSCFSWMAIEGFNLYLFLGRVYNVYVHRYVLKLCAVGWGVPVLLVLLVLATRSSAYGLHDFTFFYSNQNQSRTVPMCLMQDRMVHTVLVLGYGGATCLFNLGVLVWVLWVLRRLRARDQARAQALGSRVRQDMATVLGLTVLLGTSWGLCLFSLEVFLELQVFLFTVVNSFYGFFLFLWFCSRWFHLEAKTENEMETVSSKTR